MVLVSIILFCVFSTEGFAIGAPGLDRTRVELREVKEISVSRGDLPPSDPRYVNFEEEHKFAPNVEDNGHCAVCRARAPDSCKYSSKRFVDGEWVSSWLKVVVGKELRFRNGDKLPDIDDYNNATGMRKLLLAEFCRDKMGLFRGKKRKKFLPSDAEAAEWKVARLVIAYLKYNHNLRKNLIRSLQTYISPLLPLPKLLS